MADFNSLLTIFAIDFVEKVRAGTALATGRPLIVLAMAANFIGLIFMERR
jgi:hypothetical protein